MPRPERCTKELQVPSRWSAANLHRYATPPSRRLSTLRGLSFSGELSSTTPTGSGTSCRAVTPTFAHAGLEDMQPFRSAGRAGCLREARPRNWLRSRREDRTSRPACYRARRAMIPLAGTSGKRCTTPRREANELEATGHTEKAGRGEAPTEIGRRLPLIRQVRQAASSLVSSLDAFRDPAVCPHRGLVPVSVRQRSAEAASAMPLRTASGILRRRRPPRDGAGPRATGDPPR